jgi:hypothetical protein
LNSQFNNLTLKVRVIIRGSNSSNHPKDHKTIVVAVHYLLVNSARSTRQIKEKVTTSRSLPLKALNPNISRFYFHQKVQSISALNPNFAKVITAQFYSVCTLKIFTVPLPLTKSHDQAPLSR